MFELAVHVPCDIRGFQHRDYSPIGISGLLILGFSMSSAATGSRHQSQSINLSLINLSLINLSLINLCLINLSLINLCLINLCLINLCLINICLINLCLINICLINICPTLSNAGKSRGTGNPTAGVINRSNPKDIPVAVAARAEHTLVAQIYIRRSQCPWSVVQPRRFISASSQNWSMTKRIYLTYHTVW